MEKLKENIYLIIIGFAMINGLFWLYYLDYFDTSDESVVSEVDDVQSYPNEASEYAEYSSPTNKSTSSLTEARRLLNQLSIILESNQIDKLGEVFADNLSFYHATKNTSLNTVKTDTKTNYLNKWIIVKDEITDVYNSGTDNKFIYKKNYRIQRRHDFKYFDYKIVGYVQLAPSLNRIVGIKDSITERISSYYSSEDVESRVDGNSTFRVEVISGVEDVNVRKTPINGAVTGKVNQYEQYTVANKFQGEEVYILNQKLTLYSVETREPIIKERGYKLLKVSSDDGEVIIGRVLDDAGKAHTVKISKRNVEKNEEPWYYLVELDGWALSTFFNIL